MSLKSAKVTPIRPGVKTAPTVDAGNPPPKNLILKKGEMLFREGDYSRAMYYVKSGLIRIFKNKTNSSIEIDTIRTGQVIGELAFLDGNPRSASAEALSECELVEISGDVFTKTVAILPDWVKILLKTVVGRLRTASTRIRQMEQSSTEINYSDKGGKRFAVYISTTDILKISTALLLVGSRNGETTADGLKLKMSLLQQYANTVMGVPISKITSLVDSLTQVGILKIEGAAHEEVTLTDANFLEEFIAFLCEQSMTESAKRKDVTLKGFIIMNYIVKHINEYPVNASTGLAEVNLGAILNTEKQALGKDPFKIEDANELIRIGLMTTPAAKDSENVFTSLKPEPMKKLFSFQRVIKAIETLNTQKTQNQSRS